MGFIKFMASPAGRWTRVIAGSALVIGGVLAGGVLGIVLAVVGLVPLITGATDTCVFAPLFGQSFKGKEIRKNKGE